MSESEHGLDRWCYDALEPRVFAHDTLCATVVLRTLEVVQTVFDTNPAMFVTIIESTRTIEEHLATASPDDPAAAYLRAIRTPGPTTHVVLEGARARVTVDGRPVDGLPREVPGAHEAGVLDESEPARSRPWRVLVPPGRHVLRAGDATHDLTLAPGECRVLGRA